jgi:tRNA(adenine34) deaminase
MSEKSKRSAKSDKDSHRKGSDAKWSSKVKTVSTYPPKDLYTKDAKTVARVMATKKVSPKGLGSAIRMVQFYINRAGKNLPASRKRELEKAKRLLQEKAAKAKDSAKHRA